MKVAISGGTGLVGKRLAKLLLANNADVIILTRGEEKFEDGVQFIQWMDGHKPEEKLEGIDAFINLAGVSLNDGRWTEERKKAIYNSRMETTNEVIRIIEHLHHRPNVLINASAVGIYPTSETAIYNENSKDYANDFLGKTVQDWENAAQQAEQYGVRTCFTRFGVILSKDSGALPLMVLPYEFFVGGTVGSGEQWLSWIHVEDVANAILFTIENDKLEGPINFVSPNVKRMKQFGKTIAEALNRPHWLPVPSLALKVALGEKSQLVLEGQYVEPMKLLQHGYEFKFYSLHDAIIDLYNE